MSNVGLVNEYLYSFYVGDFANARKLVSDDFAFKGPFIEVNGKDAYFSAAARLAPMVRGHLLLQQWEDETTVCSIYNLQLETPAAAGEVIMSEWHTVRNGKLAASHLIFDTARFRELMPPPPQ